MPDNIFFKSQGTVTLDEISRISGSKLQVGDGNKIIKGVAPIGNACEDDLTFLSNKKYASSLLSSKAGACVMGESSLDKAPDGMAILVSNDPYVSYAKIAAALYPLNNDSNISNQAYISKSAKIGKNCYIEAGVYIGDLVQIGDNCRINHGSTVTHAIIGDNVIIHAGVRIGQDGFGYANDKGVHIKVPQLGCVRIQDDVEIGANSCIDRGAGPDTIIGEGTKIDNLVQIGHNVQIGKGCIIVSQVGISGSTKLGNYVVLGGQVGVAGHLKIDDMVTVAAQSGLAQDVEAKQIVGGSPAVPIKQWHKQSIILKKLVTKKGA